MLAPADSAWLITASTSALDAGVAGVGLEQERRLGPRFICSPDYGTRTSACVRVHRDGWVEFTERSFAADGVAQATVQHRFDVGPA